MTVDVRRLDGSDATAWQALQLEGLRLEPAVFLTTLAEAERLQVSDHATRIEAAMAYGAFLGGDLVGMLAVDPMRQDATAHRAVVNAVYVSHDARGQGIAGTLLTRAISDATAAGYLQLELYLEAGNAAAVRLYKKHGFTTLARIPRAVRSGDVFYDDLHMICALDR